MVSTISLCSYFFTLYGIIGRKVYIHWDRIEQLRDHAAFMQTADGDLFGCKESEETLYHFWHVGQHVKLCDFFTNR